MVARERATVYAECPSCGGTGLYQGFAEEEGYPVICVTCKGTGCKEITYKPYAGRRPKRVKGVRSNWTGSILSAGSTETISYEEFKRQIPEPNIDG